MRRYHNMYLRIGLILTSFLFIISSCNEPVNHKGDAELVFRLALQPSPSSKVWEAANLVREELERRSEGRIRVLFYSSGVLGNEQQLLETCFLGIIEMVQVTSSVVTTINPMYDLLDMPYLFMNESHHRETLRGDIGTELLESLKNYGMYGLSFYSCGFRNIYANRPVASPDDLRGMKIRVMESPVMIESMNLMGGSATSLSATEVFTALKTGVVDGAENNPNVFVSDGHIEAVKHYSLTRHFSSQHVLVANKDWMKRVKSEYPDLYELILTVPRDIVDEFDEIWIESEQKAFRDIIAQGGTITEVPGENIPTFIKAVEPVYKRKEKTVSPHLVERIRKEAGL